MTGDPEQARLAELLARTALGERAAFAQLYRSTSAKLFAVSLRIARQRPIAEEALQDSFVNIWKHASDYAQAKSAPLTGVAREPSGAGRSLRKALRRRRACAP